MSVYVLVYCISQNYASLNPGSFMLIRQTLLDFFQDTHIRVNQYFTSVLCKMVSDVLMTIGRAKSYLPGVL